MSSMGDYKNSVSDKLNRSDRWVVNALLAIQEDSRFNQTDIGDAYPILKAFHSSWSKSRDNHTANSIVRVREKIINNDVCMDILSELYSYYVNDVPF